MIAISSEPDVGARPVSRLAHILQSQLRAGEAIAAKLIQSNISAGGDLAPNVATEEPSWDIPEVLPRTQFRRGPPTSSAVLGQVGYEAVTYQIWDAYGDCLRKVSWTPPLSRMWPPLSIPLEGRPKLTREYQEIMWAVAQKMDPSFLRPIFDRYNPRPALELREQALNVREQALNARERAADRRDVEESAREAKIHKAAERLAADRITQLETELRACHEAAKARVGTDQRAATTLGERSLYLTAHDRIMQLEAKLATQQTEFIVVKAAFEAQRDADLAMQNKRNEDLYWQHKCVTAELKVNTARLQAAVDKETSKTKLELAVRRIAHKMSADPAVSADYAIELLTAVD